MMFVLKLNKIKNVIYIISSAIAYPVQKDDPVVASWSRKLKHCKCMAPPPPPCLEMTAFTAFS